MNILSILLSLFRVVIRRLEVTLNSVDIWKLKKLGILDVGKFTYGEINANFWDKETKLVIGSFVSIASGVSFILGGNHRIDWVTTYPFPAFKNKFKSARDISGHPASKGNIVVGSDVWIGQNATILSGVTIGNGVVVGACSVVTRDVPSYAICAGNPARIVGYRFDPETILKLEALAWWEWDISRIEETMIYLCSTVNSNNLDSLNQFQD